jgi:RNA polymerase sigma-70 factor (ECF subfamily)
MDQTKQLQKSGSKQVPTGQEDDRSPQAFDFAAIVSQFETPLLRYVGHLIGPGKQEAEDVVQDTFLRLHNKVERDGPASIQNLSVWLYRVAHNLAMDTGRRLTREKKAKERLTREAVEAEKAAPPEAEALGEMIRREVSEKAMSELDRLPGDLRHVVLLKVIQGMTMSQIAEVMGISASNVCYRLSQALRTISGRLKEAGLI